MAESYIDKLKKMSVDAQIESLERNASAAINDGNPRQGIAWAIMALRREVSKRGETW